uniref:SID1 transmembrane family member 1 n=1 Tax=Trichogramma kaykai TaxID=54128 RepID=A0ABD2X204_9HYME
MKTNYKIKCFYDITLLIVLVFSHTSSCLITNLNLYPTIISATFDLPYEREVDNQREYIFIYAEEDIKNTEGSKLTVESEDATLENPLIVVVRQKSGVLSWQVPLLPDIGENVDSADFSNKTSRTLCPSHHYKAIRNSTDVDKYATVTISTDSPKTISFKLRLSRLTDFYLRIDEKKTFAITPSEPIFYAYDYGDNAENSTLLVKVSSTKGTAKKCMTFSIQNATCPVFDLEKDISFDGYRQTVSQQGGMTIQRRNYPAGFFIVLIVNADDKLCHEDDEDAPQGRQKIVSLVIEKGITNKEYYIATFSTVIIIIAFCAMFFGITIYFEFHDVRRFKHAVDSNSVTDPDSIEFGAMRPRPNAEQDQNNESPPEAQHQRQQSQQEQQQAVESPQVESASDVVDRSAIGTVVNRERAIHKLVLFELSKKEPRKLREESQLYMYYLMTIAIFYAAPVVQLVITDQIMLHMTGNHDLCYYNFLCSHPLMVFSDFNHIFSNLGYVMLGALFMTIVYTRERKCADWDACNIERGIPPHYGLYYSMGFALIMEGVMSGSYHVCPSHSAFQFGAYILQSFSRSKSSYLKLAFETCSCRYELHVHNSGTLHSEDLSEPSSGHQRQSPDDLRRSVDDDTLSHIRRREGLGPHLPHYILAHSSGPLHLPERSDLSRRQMAIGQRCLPAHGGDSLRREAAAAHHRLHDFIVNFMVRRTVLLLQQDDELVQDAGQFQGIQSALHPSLLRLPRYLALPVGCGHVLLVHGAADARRPAGGYSLHSDPRFLSTHLSCVPVDRIICAKN